MKKKEDGIEMRKMRKRMLMMTVERTFVVCSSSKCKMNKEKKKY